MLTSASPALLFLFALPLLPSSSPAVLSCLPALLPSSSPAFLLSYLPVSCLSCLPSSSPASLLPSSPASCLSFLRCPAVLAPASLGSLLSWLSSSLPLWLSTYPHSSSSRPPPSSPSSLSLLSLLFSPSRPPFVLPIPGLAPLPRSSDPLLARSLSRLLPCPMSARLSPAVSLVLVLFTPSVPLPYPRFPNYASAGLFSPCCHPVVRFTCQRSPNPRNLRWCCGKTAFLLVLRQNGLSAPSALSSPCHLALPKHGDPGVAVSHSHLRADGGAGVGSCPSVHRLPENR